MPTGATADGVAAAAEVAGSAQVFSVSCMVQAGDDSAKADGRCGVGGEGRREGNPGLVGRGVVDWRWSCAVFE